MTVQSPVKKVLKRLRPYRLQLSAAVLCALVSVSLTLLIPVLVGKAIDRIIGQGQVDFENVALILGLIGGAVVGVTVCQWLMNYFVNLVSFRTVRDLRRAVFRKLNAVPLSAIDSHGHGDLISRVINDVDAVGDGLTQFFLQLFAGVVTIIGTLVFMLMTDWRIALAVFFLTPLSLFVAGFIGKLTARRFREQQVLQGDISAYVEEYVGNQRIVKAFAYEQQAFEDFDRYNTELYDVGLTVGGLSCFLTYANQYTKPFNEVTGVLTQLQTGIAAAGRVFEVLEAPDELPDAADSVSPPHRGEVTFADVSFSYTPDKPLIEHFSLHVKSGTHVAIVGPTGCGKTTLINLLMRFYDVNGGMILVDGADIRSMKRDDLRARCGMVLQDSWLFCGTIMENLRYGNENASDSEIIAAAKAAYAHSFIRRMPQGYDTVISEGGGNLSQGQKQLLCIARAMLTDPEILILDEATSSIDTLTEIRVQKAFAKMMKGRTSFVVAHRLSTIRESDIILVMRDGNIVEQGSHRALLAKKGFYHKLYYSQYDIR